MNKDKSKEIKTLSPALLAVLFMVLSGIFATTMHCLIRFATEDNHPFEVAFFRTIFVLLIFLPVVIKNGMVSLKSNNVKLQSYRAVVGSIAMLCMFYGLSLLKKKYILATQSNGNIALIVNMAKFSNLNWDVILGAEVTGHYKPEPEAYLKACNALNFKTEECLMVAAHEDDLRSARQQGMKTAYVHRPFEYGKDKLFDIAEVNDYKGDIKWDIVSRDLNDLAKQLGC